MTASRERLYLFDTTLRDGAQTTGVDFSVADKRRIAAILDDLGVDYIEGGYPGANDTDTAFFADPPPLKTATFTAFGMTKRAGRSVANDPGFQALLQSPAAAVCLVAKAWDYHVRVALEISKDENWQIDLDHSELELIIPADQNIVVEVSYDDSVLFLPKGIFSGAGQTSTEQIVDEDRPTLVIEIFADDSQLWVSAA